MLIQHTFYIYYICKQWTNCASCEEKSFAFWTSWFVELDIVNKYFHYCVSDWWHINIDLVHTMYVAWICAMNWTIKVQLNNFSSLYKSVSHGAPDSYSLHRFRTADVKLSTSEKWFEGCFICYHNILIPLKILGYCPILPMRLGIGDSRLLC